MQMVRKAKRVGVPQGKKPKPLELKTLRFMRKVFVRKPSAKNERGMP
jgi:hypothetical protein